MVNVLTVLKANIFMKNLLKTICFWIRIRANTHTAKDHIAIKVSCDSLK